MVHCVENHHQVNGMLTSRAWRTSISILFIRHTLATSNANPVRSCQVFYLSRHFARRAGPDQTWETELEPSWSASSYLTPAWTLCSLIFEENFFLSLMVIHEAVYSAVEYWNYMQDDENKSNKNGCYISYHKLKGQIDSPPCAVRQKTTF